MQVVANLLTTPQAPLSEKTCKKPTKRRTNSTGSPTRGRLDKRPLLGSQVEFVCALVRYKHLVCVCTESAHKMTTLLICKSLPSWMRYAQPSSPRGQGMGIPLTEFGPIVCLELGRASSDAGKCACEEYPWRANEDKGCTREPEAHASEAAGRHLPHHNADTCACGVCV